jgi:sterol desaturase/sphingolipid hydroxylase (fatty acid hydroxylase superfamily)
MGFSALFTEECLEAAEGRLPEGPPRPDGRRGKKPNRIPVLRNAFLEKYFAQAHPITPGLWFGPFILGGLYLGARDLGWITAPLFLSGVLLTSLIEYCLHRFAFHFNAKTKTEKLHLFLMHGYHHEFPDDPMRLVLPPIGIWPVALIIGLLWKLIFGAYFWPVFAGTAAGYVAYDWTHYYTHYFNPKSGPGRWIKRYHMLHHHDSPNHRYGITSPLWDLAFGTYLPTNKLVRQAGRHAPEPESSAVEHAAS